MLASPQFPSSTFSLGMAQGRSCLLEEPAQAAPLLSLGVVAGPGAAAIALTRRLLANLLV